ncbi:TPA: AAA family ATPase [Raoultella planticola]
MKFLKLKIENFMVIADAEVDMDNRGLVLIQGINSADSSAASNGAGKSTLMNALMWCLYGETATGYKGDDVLCTTDPKNCRVMVTIEDEGKQYAIIRHRGHKEFKNRLMVRSEDGDLTKGKDTLTQEFVERLIGSSKEVFTASIYASQEAMPDLPGMTDKNLKAIVEEAAGVDRLTKAYAIARDRSNAMAARVDNTKTKMDSVLTVIESMEREIAASKEQVSGWEKERSVRIDAAREALTMAEVGLTEVEMEMATLPAAIKRIKDKISSEKKKLSTRDEHDKKIVQVNTIIADASAKMGSASAAKDRAVALAKRAKDDADKVSASVGAPCKTCGKPYCEEDLSSVKESYMKQAREYMAEAKLQLASFTEHQERQVSAKALLHKLEAATPDVSAITAEISRLSSELYNLERRGLEVENVRKESERAKQAVDAIAAEKNPHLVSVSRHEENLRLNKIKFKDIKEELSNLEEQAALLDKARQVYAPAGVRSHILTAVTPFLNSKTSEYLSTLSDGGITAEWSTMEATKKGEIRDKFNIAVEKKGFAKDFRGLSGGEKRKVRIACSLALQDLVASRASKNIQLFIGDEIDDALDVAGLERLMGILELKARERGTVMIISHKEMKSWFRETITLDVKDGRSYVV